MTFIIPLDLTNFFALVLLCQKRKKWRFKGPYYGELARRVLEPLRMKNDHFPDPRYLSFPDYEECRKIVIDKFKSYDSRLSSGLMAHGLQGKGTQNYVIQFCYLFHQYERECISTIHLISYINELSVLLLMQIWKKWKRLNLENSEFPAYLLNYYLVILRGEGSFGKFDT